MKHVSFAATMAIVVISSAANALPPGCLKPAASSVRHFHVKKGSTIDLSVIDPGHVPLYQCAILDEDGNVKAQDDNAPCEVSFKVDRSGDYQTVVTNPKANDRTVCYNISISIDGQAQ
jgi:hypothetical protein